MSEIAGVIQEKLATPQGTPQPVQQVVEGTDYVSPPANAVDQPSPSTRDIWKRRLRLMGALVLPVFIETLDYTVVATAQPHIASALQQLSLQSWIGVTYVLGSTTFLPLWGYISDVFGRHQALQSALLLFLVGSAMCTGATEMVVLLIGRGISGVGAAGLLAVSRVILFESNKLDDSIYQSTMFAALHGFGYGFGPVLGGLLASSNWRWVFAINLPIAVVSSVLAFVLLRKLVGGPQPARERPYSLPGADEYSAGHPITAKLLRIDWIGATLFVLGSSPLLLALHWGSVQGWNKAQVVVCFAVGGCVLGAFAFWERLLKSFESGDSVPPKQLYHTEAMLPLGIFANYDVCACCYTALTAGAVIFGVFYELALFFAVSRGDSATKSGSQLLYFLPGLGVGMIISMLTIKFLRQPKYAILAGGLIVSLALGMLSRALHRNVIAEIYGFLALTGVGLGLVLSATTIHSRFSQPPDKIAAVVSITTFFNICGGTVGLAQLSAVLNGRSRAYIVSRMQDGTIPSGLLSPQELNHAISSIERISEFPAVAQEVVRTGYREGIRWAMLSLVPWTGVSFLISLGLKRIEEHEVNK